MESSYAVFDKLVSKQSEHRDKLLFDTVSAIASTPLKKEEQRRMLLPNRTGNLTRLGFVRVSGASSCIVVKIDQSIFVLTVALISHPNRV
jgi:hypothetical protein